MSILKDGIRLARLKRSIGRDHTVPRPLYPIEVAKYLQEMKDELNDPSSKKTSERLQVSTSIISDFLSLLEAPPIKYDDVWGFRDDPSFQEEGRLPFSMCRRMGKFYTEKIISEEEFGMLVNAARNNEIPNSSIEEILYLKKKNPNKSFEDCCKEIMNMVPEKFKSLIFITDIDSTVLEKIRDQAQKKSKSEEEIAESVLSKYLGNENLEGVIIKNNKHIKIAMNEKGRKKLDEIAKIEKKSLTEIITHLFLKEGYGK